MKGKQCFTTAVLLLFLSAAGLARDAREQQRIDYLIQSLSSLPGAVFIRNGKEYGAQDAKSHLEQKLSYGGERVKTAEAFIDYCASESSITHRPYQIRFADGRTTNTSTFFRERLKEFDAKQH
jgi:hypothetical protein